MIQLVLCSEDIRLEPILAGALGSEYSLRMEPDLQQVKETLAPRDMDVLVVDLDSEPQPLADHYQFLDEISAAGVAVVAMTGDNKRSTAMELFQRGLSNCIRKPLSLVELKVVIRHAYEHASMRRELEATRRKLGAVTGCDRLIGSSGRAQVVYDLIRRVANLSAFVLITGESGTGKELVARAIHNLSERASRPFVAVSCGAIPESLIEAELFGHEKGAYTGTVGAREGYLEQAGEGTLLLDEIGELSLQTQVKLLRVLQQREFSRLGTNKLSPLKARVLFATHRNLSQMVEEGSFRRDLFFRVNVMRIPVPALRERTEDIPVLANHFLTQYATEYHKPVTDILPAAMTAMVAYDWPGNIRELENVIQGAVILAEGESIGIDDLPEHIQDAQRVDEDIDEQNFGNSFEDRVRSYKLQLVQKALRECDGNKTLAARSLNISRAYLHRLIRSGESEDIDAA